ncbi:MAG: YgiQ family radical SAM protein [Deltaproteobacteria bacterium]|nr:YgiQ family radical SAM protein [Deltaproteobacteria bacterium]
MEPHLPMTRGEMDARGWRELDVLLVTGDGYFDHPSHGAAVIGRVLEAAGYRVGITARPDWRATDDFKKMGRPALFAGVTAGAVDSMLNNYTADLSRRRDDAYAPGGKGMERPNLATLVYSNRIREAFPGLPVILGGVEASTRRFAYFDYMKHTIRRSILVDSRADLLVYGPGEQQVLEIASRLATNQNLENIRGTARLHKKGVKGDLIELPPYAEIVNEKRRLVSQMKTMERATRPGFSGRLIQKFEEGTVLCESPITSTTNELDRIHELPFNRTSHPAYNKPIPALETVRWSVISLRGCPGGCSFCALAAHQGRRVVSRSHRSIIREIEQLSKHPDFKGTISDIGGPTANTYRIETRSKANCRKCRRPSCLHPKICSNLNVNQGHLLHLLGEVAKIPNVKNVFLASGIRHDLALTDPDFIRKIATNHTGGHLKVAPEHVAPDVLKRMRKPKIEQFEEFERLFAKASKKAELKQYLVPYFIAAFPGCEETEAKLVGSWLLKRNQRLRQVQTFIPLPGTMAAAYHAAGIDEKGNKLSIPDTRERKRQKGILIETKPRKTTAQKNRRPRRERYQKKPR